MAIAYDASAVVSPDATSSPFTWSHTVGSGENRLLVVGVVVATYYGQPTASAVTFNGVACVKARADQSNDGNYYTESSIWILHNPASGAHTVSVTAAAMSAGAGVSVSYSGAQQSSTADAVGGKTGTTATGSQTFTVTTVADNCWIFVIGVVLDSDTTLTAQQTSRGTVVFDESVRGQVCGEDTNAAQTPAGAKTVGFTIGSGAEVWAMSGTSFAPYGAPPSIVIPIFMNQYRQRRS